MQKVFGPDLFEAVILADPYTGGLSVPPDFFTCVSLGIAPGFSRVGGLGANPDVDTGSVPESAWSNGGRYPWIPSTRLLQIRSTSAADAPGGTGAASVSITTLDGTRAAMAPQVVALNGVTPVPIPIAAFRVNRAMAASMGSARAADDVSSNAGTIIIEDVAVPNTIRAVIPVGVGQTRQAAYTVPLGSTLLVYQILVDILSSTGAVSQYARVGTWFKTTTGVVTMPIEFGDTNGTPYRHESTPPIAVLSGWDFDMLVTNASDNNESVTVAWNGILRTNP